MVALSKFLDAGMRHATCQDLYHPGLTCFRYHLRIWPTFWTAPMRFFLPLVLIPIALKGRNVRQDHILDAFHYYKQLLITGYLIGQSTFLLFCLTRMIWGQFNRVNLVHLPVLFGTWSVLFTSDKVARLFNTTMFQMFLFFNIRTGKNSILRFIKGSKLTLTTLFMMCSSFILHNLRQHNTKVFWIIKPLPSSTEENDTNCTHTDSCFRSYLKDISTAALITIPLDLFKTFSNTVYDKESIVSTLKRIFLKFDFPTTVFLSLYISIYRLTSCYLTRSRMLKPQLRHVVAAFLGGSCFYFAPRVPLLCYGIALCVEIAWHLMKRNKTPKVEELMETFKRFRISRFPAPIFTTYLVHIFFFHPELLNSFESSIFSALTGHQAPEARKSIQCYLDKLSRSH